MWLKPQGYACISDPEEGVRECDTMTCAHCNRVTHIKPTMRPEDMGGFCRMCMKPICVKCTDEGSCTPFEKRLEEIEERDRIRRSYG